MSFCKGNFHADWGDAGTEFSGSNAQYRHRVRYDFNIYYYCYCCSYREMKIPWPHCCRWENKSVLSDPPVLTGLNEKSPAKVEAP
jgi:hypothetical protein